MKMELTNEKRKGYVVCALIDTGLLVCILVYLGYSLYRMGMFRIKMKPYLYRTGMVSVREFYD